MLSVMALVLTAMPHCEIGRDKRIYQHLPARDVGIRGSPFGYLSSTKRFVQLSNDPEIATVSNGDASLGK